MVPLGVTLLAAVPLCALVTWAAPATPDEPGSRQLHMGGSAGGPPSTSRTPPDLSTDRPRMTAWTGDHQVGEVTGGTGSLGCGVTAGVTGVYCLRCGCGCRGLDRPAFAFASGFAFAFEVTPPGLF